MTIHQAAAPADRGELGGTVFDIGYQSYGGSREGRGRGRLAIYKDGLRAALGLGRGARAKILPWLFFGVLVAIGFVMGLLVGAASRLVGTAGAESLDLPSHSDYYGIASIIFFVLAALRGPYMLCPDRRNGILSLYAVRPITGTDYVSARWLALFTVMAVVAWCPQFILFLGLTLSDPSPTGYLVQNWLDLPRLLAAGAAIAAYTTSLAMVTAAFTTRRAYASVFLIGLFLITAPFTAFLADQIVGDVGRWISMFNLSNVPIHVNDLIFGEVSAVTGDAPASDLPPAVLASWYVLWTLGPMGVLWLRYRRLPT